MKDVNELKRLMGRLGAATGCIERCLDIMTQTSRSKADEIELRNKLMKAKEAVLMSAKAIEDSVIQEAE